MKLTSAFIIKTARRNVSETILVYAARHGRVSFVINVSMPPFLSRKIIGTPVGLRPPSMPIILNPSQFYGNSSILKKILKIRGRR